MSGAAADLWRSSDTAQWRRALDAYPDVILRQNVAKLPELDTWYCNELPSLVAQRASPHVTQPELVRLTEWKMHRGVWRAPNLVRVRSNAESLVIDVTTRAFTLCPHPTKPIKAIATLDGVGPATASAVLATVFPNRYPFFDELVAAQIPELGPVAWTLGYYAKYAEFLCVRAAEIGADWSAVNVERAMWSNVGGKQGIQA